MRVEAGRGRPGALDARASRPPRARLEARAGEGPYPWLWILPALALVLLFTLYPVAHTLWTSLHRVMILLPGEPFVGLANYGAVLESAFFVTALLNSLWFTLISAPLVVLLGLGVAHLLLAEFHGRALVRSVADRGAAVLWATQRIDEIRGFADSVTFLAGGRVRFEGTVDALLAHAPRRRYVLRADGRGPEALAAAVIAGRVDEGWSIADGSVATEVGTPTVVGDSIVYAVTAQATQVRDVDRSAILGEIKGLTLPAARARLDDLGDVAIQVWPDWVTTIPTRDDRITFELAAPQPSAPPS